jgi:hypothetical protein
LINNQIANDKGKFKKKNIKRKNPMIYSCL